MPKDNADNTSTPPPFPSIDESVSVVTPTTQQPTPSQPQGEQTDPSFDIPTIVSTKPKSKFGGKKLAATIVGILLLVGAVAAGVVLVRQNQEIREQAAENEYHITLNYQCNGLDVVVGLDFPVQLQVYADFAPLDVGDDGDPDTTWQDQITWMIPAGNAGTYHFDFPQKPSGWWMRAGVKKPPYTPHLATQMAVAERQLPVCETPSANCRNITAWDTDWVSLTPSDLTLLQEGDVVRFVVAGQASSGTFDKAKFTINGTVLPETTAVRPGGTNEFYSEYTVPAGTTSFTVSAQIHHVETDQWY